MSGLPMINNNIEMCVGFLKIERFLTVLAYSIATNVDQFIKLNRHPSLLVWDYSNPNYFVEPFLLTSNLFLPLFSSL